MKEYKVFDSLFKWRAKQFVKLLNKNINDSNIELLENEKISAKPVHKIMDKVVKIGDEYHNIEFQTGKIKPKDLTRFFLYHVTLLNEHQTENIQTTIIYTEKIKEKQKCKTKQSIFQPKIFSLKEFNADKILNNIKRKIKNNQKITEDEEFHLAFLPLYETKTVPQDLLYETCKTTNQTQGIKKENIDNIKKSQLMIVDKLIKSNEEKKKYLEVITMHSESLNILIQQGKNQGKQEGIEEGRQEGRDEGSRNTTFDLTKNMLKANISINKIMEITGLSKEEITKLK